MSAPNQQKEVQQGQQNAQREQPGSQGSQGGQKNRSESLLPADDAADGRYDVAEEVSLDQQSDATRRVGQPPTGNAADGLADALKPDASKPDASKAD